MEETPLTVLEVARVLGCSDTHVYGMIARREVPHFRLGMRIRVLRSALDEFMRKTRDPQAFSRTATVARGDIPAQRPPTTQGGKNGTKSGKPTKRAA